MAISSPCRFDGPAWLVRCAGLLLFAGLPSCDSAKGEAREAKGSSAPEAPVLVRLGQFERGDVSDKLPVAADLEAVAKADVYAEVGGIIREVLVREGDVVKKGDPILTLIDDALRLAVEQKRIQAAQAKGRIAQAEIASREGAELALQKKLLLEKADSEYARMKVLAEDASRGLVSREEAEAKRYIYEQARIDYQTSMLQKEKYALEHSQALESEKLSEVELRIAEYNHSQMVLRSPIYGSISYLVAKPGEMVATSARVFTVVDTSKLEARMHVPQKELSRLRVGLPVRILCDVFPEKAFHGSVEVVNPVVDRTSGAVEVLVGVVDPEMFLKPGLFISGEIILDTRKDARLISKKAVSYENQEPIVFLVKESIARRFVLKPGYSTKTHIEVLSLNGIDGRQPDPDEWALVEVGHNNLKEGSRIQLEGGGSPNDARSSGEQSPAPVQQKG